MRCQFRKVWKKLFEYRKENRDGDQDSTKKGKGTIFESSSRDTTGGLTKEKGSGVATLDL